MLTYVYIGSVGPFENVYVNKNGEFFTFHFITFEFWCFYGYFLGVIERRVDKLSTIKSLKIYLTSPYLVATLK